MARGSCRWGWNERSSHRESAIGYGYGLGIIAPFVSIYWVLLALKAVPVSLSLGSLLKWP